MHYHIPCIMLYCIVNEFRIITYAKYNIIVLKID